MDPTKNENNQFAQQSTQPQSDVGFPPPPVREKSSKLGKILFAILGVLIIVGVGGYFLLKGPASSDDESSPSTDENNLSSFATPEPEPTTTPAPTTKPTNKSEIKIQVLNGTGTAGDASFLKKEFENLGYSDIVTGNAESQGETTTTVSFASSVSSDVVKEITTRLEALYKEVKTRKETLPEGTSVKVITGTKKGTNIKTSPSPSPSTRPSSSPSPSPSVTPTPTA